MTPPVPQTPSASATRPRRQRHDGSDIDPVKDLAEFVQSFAQSADDREEPPETPSQPVQISVPDEYAGKTAAEIIAEAKDARDKVREREIELIQARKERDEVQTRSRMDEAARRALSEQQQQQRAQSQQPQTQQVDPREAKIDQIWFADPGEARRLQRQLDDERLQQRLSQESTRIEAAIEQKSTDKQRREQGNYAFNESMRRLREAGVPEEHLRDGDKVGAVYQTITRPPTAERPNPYYMAGGPLSPDVVVQAWHKMFGIPTYQPAQAAPAYVPPVAPPGSSRPAPAAASSSNGRQVAVSSDQRRDIEHMAEAFGYDKEKMIQRRRDRIAREKDR